MRCFLFLVVLIVAGCAGPGGPQRIRQELISSNAPKPLYPDSKFGKEFFMGDPGKLDQEYAYDKSEQFMVGIKEFRQWSVNFLDKFTRNYGTLIYVGNPQMNDKERRLFLAYAKQSWLEIEFLEKWDRKLLDAFLRKGGKVYYNGAPSNSKALYLGNWLLQDAKSITVEIRKPRWIHEVFLSKFIERGGKIYYSQVPLERHYKWLVDVNNAPAITINKELAQSWKMPYRFAVNFKKNGGKIEGDKEI